MQQPDRQYYLDWLRAGAMFLLVFFHTGRLFNFDPWHIKNATENFAIHVFTRVLDVWQMPLFFAVAGAAVWFSLGRRNAREFSRERFFRILVPLIFGILIIVPPQVYVERIFDGDFTGSFLAWYPNTFQGYYSDNAATGNLSFHHLWFLAYLFVFSLLLLPLFKYLRRDDKKAILAGIGKFVSRPGTILLPAILLMIYEVFLLPIYGSGNHNLYNDWRNFLFYLTVFFSGFLLVSEEQITRTVWRQRYFALTGAVIVTVIIYLAETEFFAIAEWVILALYGFDSWLWLLAIAGIGIQLLNFDSGLRRYANDAVLPVYILHQTLIIVLGFYVITWDIPVAAKYFIIVGGVFLSALAIYEAVHRTRITRLLFGIKEPRRAVRPGLQATSVSAKLET
jgi:glucan biosynthesis protein C